MVVLVSIIVYDDDIAMIVYSDEKHWEKNQAFWCCNIGDNFTCWIKEDSN